MYRRILVPVDGSPTSLLGLDQAIALAKQDGGIVRVVFVLDELTYVTGFETFPAYAGYIVPHLQKMGRDILAAAVDRATRAGVQAESRLFEFAGERVYRPVIDDARDWGADLIVIGSHGRRGADRFFLGSDAEQIVRHAPIPVLVVHAKPAESAEPVFDAAAAGAVHAAAA